MHQKYTIRESNGLCHRCGKVPPILNRKECEECRIINRENAKRYRAYKKSKGLCRNYCNNTVLPNESRCYDCLLKERLVLHGRITREAYDRQLLLQNNSCALCSSSFVEGGKQFKAPCIDHEHNRLGCNHKKTLACPKCFRSLLCHTCNRALGLLGDNADIAIQRLEKFKQLIVAQTKEK